MIHARESQPGLTLVIGGARNRDGLLRVVALRRASTQRWEIVEISPDQPAHVLHTVFGGDDAAAVSVKLALTLLPPNDGETAAGERQTVRHAKQSKARAAR